MSNVANNIKETNTFNMVELLENIASELELDQRSVSYFMGSVVYGAARQIARVNIFELTQPLDFDTNINMLRYAASYMTAEDLSTQVQRAILSLAEYKERELTDEEKAQTAHLFPMDEVDPSTIKKIEARNREQAAERRGKVQDALETQLEYITTLAEGNIGPEQSMSSDLAERIVEMYWNSLDMSRQNAIVYGTKARMPAAVKKYALQVDVAKRALEVVDKAYEELSTLNARTTSSKAGELH